MTNQNPDQRINKCRNNKVIKNSQKNLLTKKVVRENDKNEEITHINSGITGFSSDIVNENGSRIDKLVEEYEKSILLRVKEDYNKNTKTSDKIADKIAQFGGSWKFIIILASVLSIWLLWNSVVFLPHFDEKPFILLNLLLSFTATFQAPIIMMSQNRQAKQDKSEAIIDFAINYKSEKDIDDMQGHLHRIEKEIYEVKRLINMK